MPALKKPSFAVLACLAGFAFSAMLISIKSIKAAPPEGSARAKSEPAYSQPAVSPNGREIAFVSGGAIWTAPASGGEAHLLISDGATDSRPVYSPDGSRLAFESTRSGSANIYILTLSTGQVSRITYDDSLTSLDGWSHDGSWIYFSTSNHDISYMNDVYRVSAEGGTPMPVAADRFANEYFSAPSPDGKTVAITARGIVSMQWWRKGHSHLDESEIWLVHDEATPKYDAVTDGSAKDLWPMWAADGRSLFYVSDRSGAQNVWQQPIGGAARQVTQFKDGRVLWPVISADGHTIVFERDFGVWRLDPSSGHAAEVSVTRHGVPAGPTAEHLQLSSHVSGLALSPDGKKIAFIQHGEVFAASAKDGGEAMRVTTASAEQAEIQWATDSRRIVYTSDRDGTPHLFLYDFGSNTETQLTHDSHADAAPRFSPDGKSLAFERDGTELRVMDIDSKQDRIVAIGHFGRPPFDTDGPLAWSPDSKWIAYMNTDPEAFQNVWAVPVSGGDAHAVSFLPDTFSGAVSWSPDGTYLIFAARQRTVNGEVARIDLIPHEPKFREDEFRDLFKEEPKKPSGDKNAAASASAADEAKPSAPKPVKIDWDGIRDRVSLIPTGLNSDTAIVSPDGKWLLSTAEVAGQQNLYLYSLDELAKEPPVARQLTSTPGSKDASQFSADSKEVYYLDDGQIHVAPVDAGGQARSVGVSAEMDVDFAHEKMEMFEESWTYLRDFFFDPNHNGVDWDAVRVKYEPRVAAAATPDEVRRLISLMLGELNGSHLGISASHSSDPVGRLGLDFDRAEYEASGHLRISAVLPQGPAALAGGIAPGNYLTQINGQAITPHTNIDALLEHEIGKRVVLTIASSADGSGNSVVVQPISTSDEKDLTYRQWVDANRAYVEKISAGRLGYVHIPDMGEESLEHFYLDLDTQNRSRQGVVVDIRSNTGGFVNAYALDVLSRRPYLLMTPRYFPNSTSPARSLLGQRSLELPTILVTNQQSLSDAEDFTQGYRAMHLGKVVGEPTAGWIIYTSGVELIDGSFLRLPFIRVTTTDGKPMELHPRPVDVFVKRPMGESYTGHDVQLDAAVRELLKGIPSGADH
jgi:tricorn protease